MKKQSGKINLTKITKNKVIERSYKNKNGEMVQVKELAIELVPLKEPKKIFTKENGSELWKVGFITEQSEKDSNGNYINGQTLSDITEWRVPKQAQEDEENINPEDIPF